MGLLSPGGVHSHQDHIAALVKIISNAGVPVFVHAFLMAATPHPEAPGDFLENLSPT